MEYMKSYTLTEDEKAQIKETIRVAKEKYALISEIICISNISDELLEQFEKELK